MWKTNLKSILLLKDRVTDWSAYPFSVPAIQSLTTLEFPQKVTFFVGENGSGKSTLLEAIAAHIGFGKEGGSRNISYETRQDEASSLLANALRLSWGKKLLNGYFLRAESFFNVATYLDELSTQVDPNTLKSYGGTSLHQWSHGEAFLTLLRYRFSKPGFYLLDEPEAALSPQRQLSFLLLLHQAVTTHSDIQYIIATHSPILLAYPHAQIYSFDGGHITPTSYHETETYKITSDFLKNPEAYLQKLFDLLNE